MSELFSDVLAEESGPPTQTQRQDALEAFTQKVSDEMNILVQTEGRDYSIINLLSDERASAVAGGASSDASPRRPANQAPAILSGDCAPDGP